MPTTESQSETTANPESFLRRWVRLTHSLGTKLIVFLLSAMVIIFSLLGYGALHLHRRHLENSTLAAAERLSDTLKRSAQYSMLHNDREGLHQLINTVGREPGIIRIRIINKEGIVNYSTDPHELQRQIDASAESCTGCHNDEQTRTELTRMERFRIHREGKVRVLSTITPIENQPSCSNAECHAHPASQKVLGVLDSSLSLEAADANLRESSFTLLSYVIGALVLMGVLIGIFIWRFIERPVQVLMAGTKHLTDGELGYQIDIRSQDEFGDL